MNVIYLQDGIIFIADEIRVNVSLYHFLLFSTANRICNNLNGNICLYIQFTVLAKTIAPSSTSLFCLFICVLVHFKSRIIIFPRLILGSIFDPLCLYVYFARICNRIVHFISIWLFFFGQHSNIEIVHKANHPAYTDLGSKIRRGRNAYILYL